MCDRYRFRAANIWLKVKKIKSQRWQSAKSTSSVLGWSGLNWLDRVLLNDPTTTQLAAAAAATGYYRVWHHRWRHWCAVRQKDRTLNRPWTKPTRTKYCWAHFSENLIPGLVNKLLIFVPVYEVCVQTKTIMVRHVNDDSFRICSPYSFCIGEANSFGVGWVEDRMSIKIWKVL